MEYLKKVLGVRTEYLNETDVSLPNYIRSRYLVREIRLDGRKAVFVYPRTELDAISAVRKHIERIRSSVGVPAILVPNRLNYRQREYLLRDRIPFIVDARQIYLPFMAIYLQEKYDGEKSLREEILPSAQLLFLYFIYHGCDDLLTSDAAKALRLTPTSISRASRQLEEMGLIGTERRGVQKALLSDKPPRELFEFSADRLTDPVKRTVFVPASEIDEPLLLSGYSALAEYSRLNPPAAECRAAFSVAKWAEVSTQRLQDPDDQIEIELWRYDPRILADGRRVDRLSLALALREDGDERTEVAVGEMLSQVWRDIDGTGN